MKLKTSSKSDQNRETKDLEEKMSVILHELGNENVLLPAGTRKCKNWKDSLNLNLHDHPELTEI